MKECIFATTSIQLIDVNFGGNCLIEFKDHTLRCAHFLRYEVEIYNWTRFDTKYVFDAAGIGIMKLDVDQIRFVYKNLADYKSKRSIGTAPLAKKYVVESCFPKDSFSVVDSSYTLGYLYKFVHWKWNGIRAYSEVIKCPEFIIHDEYGYHFDGKFSLEPNTYATKEECERNNEIKVIGFDDDNKRCDSQYVEEVNVIKDSFGNTHTITLVIDKHSKAVVKTTIEN